jgi:hypothetical protein
MIHDNSFFLERVNLLANFLGKDAFGEIKSARESSTAKARRKNGLGSRL